MLFIWLLACDALLGGSDEGDLAWADLDGDGFAIAEGDCNDEDAAVHPDAEEACNGVDDNCDDAIDEGWQTLWYIDEDLDGFGDPSSEVDSCDQPANYIPTSGDCDDEDPQVFPSADEVCNGIDDDCDGDTDEETLPYWFLDEDGDGYGDPSQAAPGCDDPGWPYVSNDFDCDDDNAAINDVADDICDGLDNDCDGELDEDADVAWYADDDGDGAGDPEESVLSCEQPEGYVDNADDCDPEDGGYATTTWYADTDGDGTGDAEVTTTACTRPEGYTDNPDDCDDASADTGAPATWYYDFDNDGYGDEDFPTESCSEPSGYVDNDGDCDDSSAAVSPSGLEICNGVDDDCDGDTDEAGSAGESTWYADTDGDGYGDSTSTTEACDEPTGYVSNDDDCDDSDSGTTTESTWYIDSDGDGYGSGSASTKSCTEPNGYSADTTDCDDTDADVNPGATETCNGTDDDCDADIDEAGAVGESTWYADTDGDGHGDRTADTTACDQPSGYVAADDDCDDTDATVSPDADEYCDSIDNDCDGSTDEDDAIDADTWYADTDGDGYGDSSTTTTACDQPSGYVDNDDDCDDTSSGTGCETEHCGTISSDETWATGDHLITCDVVVDSGAILTIEDGSTIEVDPGYSLMIGSPTDSGDLEVDGSTGTGVWFTSSASSPARGDWGGIYLSPNSSASYINYAQIEYAGMATDACLGANADVILTGVTVQECGASGLYIDQGAHPDISDSTFQDNDEYGIELSSTAGLGTFSNNTMSGNTLAPIDLPVDVIDSLDSGSSYSGNGELIQLRSGTVDFDHTFLLLDEDYSFVGTANIGTTANVDIDFESGVRFEMESNAEWVFGDGSTHTANLTADTVEWTGDTASVGHWRGLQFKGGTHALDSCVVEYGGKVQANLTCDGCTLDVTNSDVSYSGGDGIKGVGSTSITTSGNTYTSNTGSDENF